MSLVNYFINNNILNIFFLQNSYSTLKLEKWRNKEVFFIKIHMRYLSKLLGHFLKEEKLKIKINYRDHRYLPHYAGFGMSKMKRVLLNKSIGHCDRNSLINNLEIL